MNPSDQYLAKLMMNVMLQPLKHPESSVLVSVFTPCELIQEAGLYPVSYTHLIGNILCDQTGRYLISDQYIQIWYNGKSGWYLSGKWSDGGGNYLSLIHIFRPDNFEDVKGQDHIVTTLTTVSYTHLSLFRQILFLYSAYWYFLHLSLIHI